MIPLLLMLAVQTPPADRSHEGDWYVSDTTDNNTGEREVYAFQTYLKRGDPTYVTLTMRCSSGKPTFFVDWQDVSFPDQAVLTIGPVASPDSEPAEQQYVFQKSDDPIERGMRASPETSAKIIAAIGEAKYAIITAHLSFGSPTVGIDVSGTQGAWNRVLRHCPIQKVQRPPL
jgi:hypothetical protein